MCKLLRWLLYVARALGKGLQYLLFSGLSAGLVVVGNWFSCSLGMRDLPGPGIELESLAWQGDF